MPTRTTEKAVTTLLEALESVVTSPLQSGGYSKYELRSIHEKWFGPIHENKAHQKMRHFMPWLGALWLENRERVIAAAELAARQLETDTEREVAMRERMSDGRLNRRDLGQNTPSLFEAT